MAFSKAQKSSAKNDVSHRRLEVHYCCSRQENEHIIDFFKVDDRLWIQEWHALGGTIAGIYSIIRTGLFCDMGWRESLWRPS